MDPIEEYFDGLPDEWCKFAFMRAQHEQRDANTARGIGSELRVRGYPDRGQAWYSSVLPKANSVSRRSESSESKSSLPKLATRSRARSETRDYGPHCTYSDAIKKFPRASSVIG